MNEKDTLDVFGKDLETLSIEISKFVESKTDHTSPAHVIGFFELLRIISETNIASLKEQTEDNKDASEMIVTVQNIVRKSTKTKAMPREF